MRHHTPIGAVKGRRRAKRSETSQDSGTQGITACEINLTGGLDTWVAGEVRELSPGSRTSRRSEKQEGDAALFHTTQLWGVRGFLGQASSHAESLTNERCVA